MANFLHVMICYQDYKPNLQRDAIFDTSSSLNLMTAPFQIAFDSVFGEVRVRKSQQREVKISSLNGTVERIFIFASDKARLNGTERDDLIVYFRILIDGIDAETVDLLTTNSPVALTERQSVIEQAFGGEVPLHLSSYSRYPGHQAWISEVSPDEYTGTIACISAFYFYGWILALRIERNQLRQDITPQIRAGDKIVAQIIEQRMRLLNLDRYFLVGDRTTNSYLKEICTKLSERFRLGKRHRKMSERHAAFESHIDNTSTALQAQRTASLTNMVFVFTCLSVPFAAMQVLFGMSLDSSIYLKTAEMISNTKTYVVALAAFAVVGVLVLLLMLVARIHAHIVQKLRNLLPFSDRSSY